jgi:hypothetical protein
MGRVTVSPEQQLQNIADALGETEYRLRQRGIDVFLLRTWLNQTLHERAMQERYARGELQTIEFDEADGDY